MTESISQYAAGSLIAGRYQIERTLGCGAMGSVFLARDMALDQEKLCLKVLHPQYLQDERAVSRFRQEVILSRRLSHPNIVRIYDFGEEKNAPFFTMEYINGISLEKRIYAPRHEQLSFNEVVYTLLQVAEGIAHAHSEGVVHRDLKPANILITPQTRAKITDFGLARSLIDEKNLTLSGNSVGTPLYMSPEQFRGEKVDRRCDIYALGIIAYELVVGARPFDSDEYLELATLHLAEPLSVEALKTSGAPAWYRELVQISTEKDRESRYENMAELAAELRKHLEDSKTQLSRVPAVFLSQLAGPNPRAHRRFLLRKFRPAITALSALLLLTLIIGTPLILSSRYPTMRRAA